MRFDVEWMDMLNSRAKRKIVGFLLNNEVMMSERQIAASLDMTPMTVNRAMRELSTINLVNCTPVGRAHLWKVNRKSLAFKILTRLCRVIGRTTVPLEDLKSKIIKHLPKRLIKNAVISGAAVHRGRKPDRQIKLIIENGTSVNTEKNRGIIDQLSAYCLDRYGNRLVIYFLSRREFKKRFYGARGRAVRLMAAKHGRCRSGAV
jgi:predicted transcriptional regulator